MTDNRLILMSQMAKDEQLFQECLRILSTVDPKGWPTEKILHALDVLHYDCLVYANSTTLIGAVAFNPNRDDNIAKVFLIFITPENQGKGIGKMMVAEFLRWAHKQNFLRVQVGLGRNPATVSILKSLKDSPKKYNISDIVADIVPETGVILFQ